MPIRHTRPLLIALALAAALGGCSPAVEDTRPGQPVKTRQVAFKEILKTFEPMGVMLRTGGYQPDKFAGLAGELMAKRDAPWAHFGPDTHYPPTKAKAAVWSDAARFEQEKQAFLAATAALQAAAQTRDKDAAEKAYFKVYDLCQSCHERFKER